MFGKRQPDVVTEEDVGKYIDELQDKGNKEIQNFIEDVEAVDGVVNSSREPSNKPED